MTTLQVGLLGPFRVSVGGEPVDVPAGRLRALLATLALSAGQPVSADRLVTAVWGQDAEVDARVNLHSNVRRLRRLLGADLVATCGGGYALQADPDEVDALRFVRLLDGAAGLADPRAQRDRLAAVLELWRGTPLEGVRSDWLEHTQAPRLQERYLAALERRVDLDLAGTPAAGAAAGELAAELGELTGRYPLREPLWVRLLVALERSGRPAEALQRYEAVRVRLAEELGADPGPELRRVHADLLAGRPPRLPPGTPRAPLRVVPRQLPAGTDTFTGRESALKTLDGLLDGEGDPSGRPVVVAAIAGTAGIGKTTLALHWAHRVAGRFPDGQLYVNLRGFDPSGSPVEPAEAVRGFLEALQVPPQQVPAGLDAQAGLYRSLLAGRRMLVLLDNARDAAQAAPLLPGAPGCLAIVTSRDQLPGLVAAGAHPVTLDLLGPGEAVELLARRLSHDRVAAEPGASAELVAGCAGLPLALAIVAARAATRPELPLAALAGQLRETRDRPGALDGLDAGDATTSARGVFSWSYRSLREPAAKLFRLLGIHPGPDVGTAAAASLAGIPTAQARSLLAELARAHLLAEPAPGRYGFHDLLRAYAAELANDLDTEAERQAATHRLLDHYLHTAIAADTLLFCERRPLDPPRRGATVERPGDPEAALAWFTAEHQALVSAVRHAGPAGFDRHACRLAGALDVFLHRRGHWHERASVHETAVAAAGRLGDGIEQGRAHRDFARALADLGRFEDADRHFRAALDRWGAAGDLAGQASVHYERNHVDALRGRIADALAAAREAHRLYVAAGDQVGQANALTDVGWHLGQLGDREQAVTLLRQSLSLHERFGNRTYQAHTWSCLAEIHARSGDHAQAITCYRRCLELFQYVGDRYGEASTLAHLAAIHAAAGDPTAAHDAWERARDILATLDPPVAAQLHGQLRQRGPTTTGDPPGRP